MLVSSMDSFEASFGRILSAPAIGQSRETTELLAQSFDAWSEMNRAAVEFQTDIINQGLSAWEDLFQELVEMGTRGDKVTSLHQFFDLYVDTAEKAYASSSARGHSPTCRGILSTPAWSPQAPTRPAR